MGGLLELLVQPRCDNVVATSVDLECFGTKQPQIGPKLDITVLKSKSYRVLFLEDFTEY